MDFGGLLFLIRFRLSKALEWKKNQNRLSTFQINFREKTVLELDRVITGIVSGFEGSFVEEGF